ncbi:type VI secretion system-associated protein TagF [Lampropedia aestuarii]|uniref:Type VI secretion system-associated protein TagF n=1 Tax=Lampropedia aestuarii TaxID=2562762 RepID=A0A4S5BFP7_9BURK|nr:type VI secretion system-associated protein TagF [Lampropedia aestuarii]MDH5857397.1 type VI secretion system-associated protein TagF [Lampropedia aestuarii]THJ31060.1 type VI secretion system-associated protein TagF [Lampropedia aestuarii]
MVAPAQFVGWLGKLPAVGDFASRGLEPHLQSTIHQWISQGMRALSVRDPDEWQHAYLVTPVWHFVINAGVWHPHALQGCLAPSLDKVGRYSPLLMLRSFEHQSLSEVLPPADDWSYRVDARLRQVIGQRLPVEQVAEGVHEPFSQRQLQQQAQSAAGILNALGITEDSASRPSGKRWFSWPDLSHLFASRQHRSYWWAEPSPKQPPRQIIHSGQPDEELFVLLMGGALFVAGT